MNKLSTFVKDKRQDLAMTQDDYAKLLDVSTPTLIKIEQGQKVGLATVRLLADYYKLEPRHIRRMMIIGNDQEKEQ